MCVLHLQQLSRANVTNSSSNPTAWCALDELNFAPYQHHRAQCPLLSLSLNPNEATPCVTQAQELLHHDKGTIQLAVQPLILCRVTSREPQCCLHNSSRQTLARTLVRSPWSGRVVLQQQAGIRSTRQSVEGRDASREGGMQRGRKKWNATKADVCTFSGDRPQTERRRIFLPQTLFVAVLFARAGVSAASLITLPLIHRVGPANKSVSVHMRCFFRAAGLCRREEERNVSQRVSRSSRFQCTKKRERWLLIESAKERGRRSHGTSGCFVPSKEGFLFMRHLRAKR